MHIEIPELKRIIKFYGEQAQTVIFCEECVELIQLQDKTQDKYFRPMISWPDFSLLIT